MRSGWRSVVGGLRNIAVDLVSPARRLTRLSALSPPCGSSEVHRQIACRQFRALIQNYPASMVTQSVAVLLWLVVIWHYNPGWGSATWGAAAVVATAAVALFLYRFSRSRPADEALRAWEVRLGWLSWATGMVWGLGSLPSPNHLVVAPYNALASLLVLAGMLSLHTIYRPSISWMTVPCALVMAVSFVWRGGWLYAGIAVLYLVGVVLLVRLAWVRNTWVTQVMVASEERRALLREIEGQRDAAQHANEAKTRFLAAVSHDLRQPLHAIAALSGALRQRSSGRVEVIDQLDASVQDMGQLLGELPHAAARHPRPAPVPGGPDSPAAAGILGPETQPAASAVPWRRAVAQGVRETVAHVLSPWRSQAQASPAIDGSEFSRAISSRQLRALFDKKPSDLIANLAGSTLCVIAWALLSPGPAVVVWGACRYALVGAGWWLLRQYASAQPADDALGPWEARQGRLAILQSILWGSVWFCLPATAVAYTPYVATVLFLVMAGSMSRFVGHRPALSWWAVPCTALTCVGLLALGSVHDAVIGVGFVVAMAFMVRLGRVQNALITRSLLVAEERVLLLAQLEGQRAAAHRANEAKTRFLAAVSHDLRQPMHAISLLSGALRQPSGEQAEALGQIGASVQAMDDMLAALLEVSRLDDGALPLQVAPLAVGPLLERLALQFAAPAQAKGLALEVRPVPGRIRSDAYQLQRILANLVANAIRYTPSGRVLVRCRVRANVAWLQVWDSGLGIGREDRERVFEEFVQLAPAQRHGTDGPGLGLGLSLVRRLAQRLGHPVVLRSRPGRGSVFAIGVPLDDTVAHQEDEAALTALLAGQLVLLIDDDAAVRKGMGLLLGAFGCHVLTACSTASALEAVQESLRTPDIIVSDFWLGGDDTGLAAIAQVRALVGERLPALLMTAALPAARAAAQPHGITVLAKPLRVHSLAPALAHALREAPWSP
jgi:signal transduction histidine kinase/ActR/RegA family two-component response regulator